MTGACASVQPLLDVPAVVVPKGIGEFWMPVPERFVKMLWRAAPFSRERRAEEADVWAVVFWLLKSGEEFKLRELMRWASRSSAFVTPIVEAARAAFQQWTGKPAPVPCCGQLEDTERTPSGHLDDVCADVFRERPDTCRTGSEHIENTPLSISAHARQQTTPNTAQGFSFRGEKSEQISRPAAEALVAGPEGASTEGRAEPSQGSGTPLAAVAGRGRGMLWADLVRDLEAAGYSTLDELAAAGRDTVADDLGRSASSRRLDRIRAALESRQLSVDLWHPPGPHSNASAAGRPADGLSLNRGHHPRGRRRLSGLWAETPEETQQRRLANARAAALGGVQ